MVRALLFSVACFVPASTGCNQNSPKQLVEPGVETNQLANTQPTQDPGPLHAAAKAGEISTIERLLSEGADVNAGDQSGMTALHYAAQNGHGETTQKLLSLGADPLLRNTDGKTARDLALANHHDGTAGFLPKLGNAAETIAASGDAPEQNQDATPGVQSLNPELKYPDLESFEAAIGGPACMLTSEHVHLYAPKVREAAAHVVFPYLVRAYDELKNITGVDTEYNMVVYNFPKGHRDAKGNTSNCTIWYDDSNLDLEQHEEWRQYKVPHVSGYIEEMAHNFDGGLHATFGWEMTGWSIGMLAVQRVASNPIFEYNLAETRRGQEETYRRYVAAGFVFPSDIEANQVDRIHGYLLNACEQHYGASFWPDAFTEIRKRKDELAAAVSLSDGDAIRNKRYQNTIECFDKLRGLDFKKMLEANGISTTTDVKSLHPTEPGWNRRLW